MADARSGRRPPRSMDDASPCSHITPPIAPGHGARGVCVSAPPGWGPHVVVRTVRKEFHLLYYLLTYLLPSYLLTYLLTYFAYWVSALYAQGLAF